MLLNENSFSYYRRIGLLIFTALFLSANISIAQSADDSSGNVLLANVSKKEIPAYIIKEANVVFPDILKGNETEAIPYIEAFSTSRRAYLLSMYSKGKKLLPKAAVILKKHQLPEELKVLLALESGYNGKAVSKAGAVGYWQFMDVVAREYGLKYVPQNALAKKGKIFRCDKKQVLVKSKKQGKIKDDRMNFLPASNAAARYLQDRRRNLNDNWLLVVASYNCGIGNVWNAMEKSGKTGPTFWDVKEYLPEETQNYVMNFIALNVIFNNYDNFLKTQLVFNAEKIYFNQFDQSAASDYTDKPATTKLR